MDPLCQRGSASCGACCGLYNRADLSRAGVREALDRRTAALAGVPRTAEAYRAVAARLRAEEAAPLFPLVRVCPLLGWLDEEATRVGCLAHPLVTGGPDLRDCGVYDVRTCDTFFCPSHSWLAEEEAAIAADALGGDPYLYGLVVTDVPFLRAALDGVARLAGVRVRREHLAAAPFRRTLVALLALKEELAPGSEGLFGAFRPAADGEPVPRVLDYAALGRDAPSPYDALLLAVGADPRSGNDLDALEEEVGARLEACAAALP
ncbi:MAG TPA: hypothetical protein VFP65_22720 [Anaeromyxobacteraceae bacterium]|nr:hypothetical protein [Anaeromyxobacteraceae bacterium]